jgi:hypothetical protein
VNGDAWINAQKGDYPAAIRAQSKAHAAEVVAATLHNHILLSGMPRTWVDEQNVAHPNAFEAWVLAVGIRRRGFHTEIADAIAVASNKRLRDIPKFHLSFCGKNDIIYLDVCPLCGTENVRLQRVDPAQFRPRLPLIGKLKACDHRLPVRDELWQAILNASLLIREKQIFIE